MKRQIRQFTKLNSLLIFPGLQYGIGKIMGLSRFRRVPAGTFVFRLRKMRLCSDFLLDSPA